MNRSVIFSTLLWFKVCLVSSLFVSSQILANGLSCEVLWATEYWPGLVTPEGDGLYDEIMREVFSKEGITVDRKNMPFYRALAEVRGARFHVTGGLRKTSHKQSFQLYSERPVLEVDIVAFYNQRFGAITDIGDLEEAFVCSTRSYLIHYPSLKLPQVIATKSRALEMTLSGRCDVFLGNKNTIHKLIEDVTVALGRTRAELNVDEFNMTSLGRSKVYMVFSRTEKGQVVKSHFDKKIQALYESGRLAEVYASYGFNVPFVN